MIAWLLLFLEFLVPWNRICPRPEQPRIFHEPQRLSAGLTAQSARSLEERISYWSGMFLGAPYAVDPMGEGAGPDPDPVVETCAFDCETYVELVLALAFSRTPPEVTAWLDRMRYLDGRRDISSRYYTMALHWIPGNEKLGYLSPLGLRPYATVSRPVFPGGRWWPVHRERLALLGDNAPSGQARVRYNPIHVLLEQEARIPTPTLAFLVGARQIGNPFLITHMGFILTRADGRRVFRHASRTPGRLKVEERELGDYLRSLRRHFNEPANPRRYVLGMSLYRLQDPPATPEAAR